jgi:hypothetical protein
MKMRIVFLFHTVDGRFFHSHGTPMRMRFENRVFVSYC